MNIFLMVVGINPGRSMSIKITKSRLGAFAGRLYFISVSNPVILSMDMVTTAG